MICFHWAWLFVVPVSLFVAVMSLLLMLMRGLKYET
jgi:hypothetical protein